MLGEAPPPPLLIHFLAGLPILSNLVALSVSHTRSHLTELSSLIDLSPPLPLLFRIAAPHPSWVEGRKTFEREEENSATRRGIKFNRALLRDRRYSVQSGSFHGFMIVGIFFVSSNKPPLQSNNACFPLIGNLFEYICLYKSEYYFINYVEFFFSFFFVLMIMHIYFCFISF